MVSDPLLCARLLEDCFPQRQPRLRTKMVGELAGFPRQLSPLLVCLLSQPVWTVSDELLSWYPPHLSLSPGKESQSYHPEELNKRAVAITQRVKLKLTGNDFANEKCLDVDRQVQLLIEQATSHENLCQCYIGWCPFW